MKEFGSSRMSIIGQMIEWAQVHFDDVIQKVS
jgi:hypothetical protein